MQVAHHSPMRAIHGSQHAHPSPMHTNVPNDLTQRLKNLAASLPLSIQLAGLAAGDKNRACDAYCPRARRTSLSPNQEAVQHVDVVTCWKGLTYSQASELSFWEQAFRHCLASQIEHVLRNLIAAQLSKPQKLLTTIPLLFRLNECLAGIKQYAVKIDVMKLVNDMIDFFHKEAGHCPAERRFSWAISSGDLPRFLSNFIRTQDCLLYGEHVPTVQINKTTHDYSYPEFTVTVELDWSPPAVRFEDLPISVKPEDAYCIAPTYRDAMDPKIGEPYLHDIHYTLDQSGFTAKWDAADRCHRIVAMVQPKRETSVPGHFHTIEPYVATKLSSQRLYRPLFSHVQQAHKSKRFSATIITFFPSNVRFELCSRYIIAVPVILTEERLGDPTPKAFHHINSPPPVTEPLQPYYHTAPLSETSHGKVMPDVPDSKSPGASPIEASSKKRKVDALGSGSEKESPTTGGSQGSASGIRSRSESDIKRLCTIIITLGSVEPPALRGEAAQIMRHLIQLGNTNTLPGLPLGHVDESEVTVGSELTPSPAILEGTGTTEEARDLEIQGRSHDGDVDSVMDPLDTSTPTLSQEEILQNYLEFEELAKMKSENKGNERNEDFTDFFSDDGDLEDLEHLEDVDDQDNQDNQEDPEE